MRFRNRTIFENVFCLAVISLVPVALLTPGVLRDAIPVDATSVFRGYTPWEGARPAGVPMNAKSTANIEAQRYFPWYVF